MHSRNLLVVAVTVAAIVSCSSPGTGLPPTLKTDFVPGAVPSGSELQQLIELAKRCGVSQVGELYSYHIHLTPCYGFGVKSVETVDGREVSFVRILVDHKKWIKPRRGRDVEESVGKFWVSAGSVRSNVLTTFALPLGTVRAHLSRDVDLATADRIIELFARKQIKYKDPELKKELGEIEMSDLEALSRSENGTMFSISFSCGDLCLVWADFTLDADGVTVVKIGRIVS